LLFLFLWLVITDTIDPTPLPPWREPAFVEINIEPDREKAKDKATALRATSGTIVYSDASGQHNQLGAAAVALDKNLRVVESRQICVELMKH
jgi:hypothetical protein